MKKIFFALSIVLLFFSCSPDSETQSIRYELLPVSSYVFPTKFLVNTENSIKIEFLRPTSCHGFDGFLYEVSERTRKIAIQSYVLENNTCLPTSQLVIQTLKFKPTELGTYLLRFWKGKDVNGDDTFEEVSIVVE